MHIKVGTRSSRLALWQTNFVIEKLQKQFPQHTFEIVEIHTKGDKIQDVSLQKIGDKGVFVKEIEDCLLRQEIDMAVHSMKDMPSMLPEGLCFTKTLVREDARDVLIVRDGICLKDIKEPILGTGSVRRSVQLKQCIKNVIIKDIRGNVDTRLRKLDEGLYDGIVMAAAGIKRLGLENRITQYFEPEEIIPASAQGALAIEVHKNHHELITMLNAISDQESHACVMVEREFLRVMQGSCHVPIGVYCRKIDGQYCLDAMYGEDEAHVVIFHGVHADKKELLSQAIQAMKGSGYHG